MADTSENHLITDPNYTNGNRVKVNISHMNEFKSSVRIQMEVKAHAIDDKEEFLAEVLPVIENAIKDAFLELRRPTKKELEQKLNSKLKKGAKK